MPLFTTWNPSDKSANLTLSGGNLTLTYPSGSGDTGIRTIQSKTAGKWYFEMVPTATGGADSGIGICTSTATLTGLGPNASGAVICYQATGSIWRNGASFGSGPGGFSGAACMSCAFDLDNRKVWFRKNAGLWMGAGGNDPAANTGGVDISSFVTLHSTIIFPCACANSTTVNWTFNFGGSAFIESVPSGFAGISVPQGMTGLARPFLG